MLVTTRPPAKQYLPKSSSALVDSLFTCTTHVRGSTRSSSVENSLWKRIRNGRKIDSGKNELRVYSARCQQTQLSFCLCHKKPSSQLHRSLQYCDHSTHYSSVWYRTFCTKLSVITRINNNNNNNNNNTSSSGGGDGGGGISSSSSSSSSKYYYVRRIKITCLWHASCSCRTKKMLRNFLWDNWS